MEYARRVFLDELLETMENEASLMAREYETEDEGIENTIASMASKQSAMCIVLREILKEFTRH